MPYRLLIFALALLLLPLLLRWAGKWVVAPIRTRRRNVMVRQPNWTATSAEALSPEMQEFLGSMVHKFRAEGFEVAANVRNPDGVDTAQSTQVLMVNRATHEVAAAAAIVAIHQRSLSMFIRCEYADGNRIATANTRSARTHPPHPDDDGQSFCWVKEPAVLLEAHRRRVARAGRADQTPIAPAPGEELAYLNAQWSHSLDWWVRCGYRYFDEKTDRYRLTWKGAYLLTWRLTEPLKQMRLRRYERRARRVWNELGMDDWRPAGEALPEPAIALPPVAASISATQPLRYETALPEGEVRIERTESGIVVRVGSPTPARVLVRHWGALVFLALCLLGIGSAARQLWFMYALLSRSPMLARAGLFRPQVPLGFMAFWALMMTIDIRRLLRALSLARGTVSVSATRDGLRFFNVPGKPHSGQIPRDELYSLTVLNEQSGLGRRSFRLVAKTRGSAKPQILLVTRDLPVLQSARAALADALGIAVPDPNPSRAPVPPENVR